MEYKRIPKHWKWLLTADYTHKTGIENHAMGNGFLSLDNRGTLIVKRNYAWDGASGPAVDTKTIMRASLVHDAIYQLLREGLPQHHKETADQLLRAICLADGMSKFRAWYVYQAVRHFAPASSYRLTWPNPLT